MLKAPVLLSALAAACACALSLSASVQAAPALEFSKLQPLNTNAAGDDGDDFSASGATNGKGTWIVVWQSSATLGGKLGSDFDILLARSTDGGKHWSAPRPLAANAPGDVHEDLQPRIATDGRGLWTVIWSSDDPRNDRLGLDTDLLVSYSRDDGESWSQPEPLYGSAATDDMVETGVSVAADAKGNWVATFVARPTTDTEAVRRDLYCTRRPAGSNKWTDAVRVNPDVGGNLTSDNTSPVLAITPEGAWRVIWRNRTADVTDLYQSTSKDAGKTWGHPRALYALTGKSHTSSGPRVAADGKQWMTVWVSADLDREHLGRDQDIVFVRSEDAGETWTEPKPLNTDAASDDAHARDEVATVAGANGEWVAAWMRQEGYGEARTDTDVRAAFSADGKAWSEPFFVNDDAGADSANDVNPQVLGDGSGNWFVIWERIHRGQSAYGDDRDLFFSVAHSATQAEEAAVARAGSVDSATE